jgi:hypothetical protein
VNCFFALVGCIPSGDSAHAPGGVLVVGEQQCHTVLPATTDRLVHHSAILALNLSSYRMDQARENRRAGSKTKDTPD